MRVLRDVLLGLACAALGVGLWLEMVESTGALEVWDHSAFWTMAVPIMVVGSLIAGTIGPESPWVWGSVMVAAQMVALLGRAIPEQGENDPSLLPVGLLFVAVIAVPCIAAGYLGSWLRRRGGSDDDDVSVDDVPSEPPTAD